MLKNVVHERGYPNVIKERPWGGGQGDSDAGRGPLYHMHVHMHVPGVSRMLPTAAPTSEMVTALRCSCGGNGR